MSDMQDQLGAILNNPQMMQQIMSMAQAFQTQQPESSPEAQPTDSFPELDMNMLHQIRGLAQSSRIDQREQALLGALRAYLSTDRVTKLEKAMRAAKLAKLASGALGQSVMQSLLGR